MAADPIAIPPKNPEIPAETRILLVDFSRTNVLEITADNRLQRSSIVAAVKFLTEAPSAGRSGRPSVFRTGVGETVRN